MIGIICLFVGLIIGVAAGRQLLLRQNLGEALVANTLGKLDGLHVLISDGKETPPSCMGIDFGGDLSVRMLV